MTAAKIFGVKVTQFMIGFGNTLWSRKKGETEYGVKSLPIGGYIAMIGMFPPGPDGQQPKRGRLAQLIDSARQSSAETVQPGEEDRAFYAAAPWKRIIIMFAGPFMNVVLAVSVLTGLYMVKFQKVADSDMEAVIGHVMTDSPAA